MILKSSIYVEETSVYGILKHFSYSTGNTSGATYDTQCGDCVEDFPKNAFIKLN